MQDLIIPDFISSILFFLNCAINKLQKPSNKVFIFIGHNRLQITFYRP
jgi:hypothetical protein